MQHTYRLHFTLDYEIHGNGDGDPMHLMVEPTYRLMNLLEKYGQRCCIMADVAEILRFREYYEQTGEDKFSVLAIEKQLQEAIRRGHDVQLHIHSSYFRAKWDGKHWDQYIEEYNMAALPYERINEMVQQCTQYLNNLLRPIKADYRCHIFRAANWSMMPTPHIYEALVNNGIDIDTSVYKGGKQGGNVCYDYTTAFDALYHYPASRWDINNYDPNGKITEYPIYCEMHSAWYFLSFIRLFRMIRAKFHRHKKVESQKSKDRFAQSQESKVESQESKDNSQESKVESQKSRANRSMFGKSPWKMDFNQATARQLIKAFERIQERSRRTEMPIVDVVLIGHSKSFIPYNEKTLEPFLQYIENHRSTNQ